MLGNRGLGEEGIAMGEDAFGQGATCFPWFRDGLFLVILEVLRRIQALVMNYSGTQTSWKRFSSQKRPGV